MARRNPALHEDDVTHDARHHLGHIGDPMAIEAEAISTL